MSFKNKYIKYKLKYLNLKQSGGEGLPIHINLNNTQNQPERPSVRILSPRMINGELQYVYNLPNFHRYRDSDTYRNDYNYLITRLSNRSINDLSLDELELLAYFSNSMINTINSSNNGKSKDSKGNDGSKDSKGDDGSKGNNGTNKNSNNGSKGDVGTGNNGSNGTGSKGSKDSKGTDNNSTDEKLKDIKVVEGSDEEKKLKEALIEEYNKNTKRNNALALLQKIKENSVVTRDELENALFDWLGLNRNNNMDNLTDTDLRDIFKLHMEKYD